MNKKITRLITIFIGILMTISALVGTAQMVYGAATDDGDIHGHTPPKNGQTRWDTSYGAVWVSYPVDGNNNIRIPDQLRANGTVSVEGGTLRGCVDDGATIYYRLGLNKYRYNSDPSKIQPLADQAGLIPASMIGSGVSYATGAMSVWGARAISNDQAKYFFSQAKDFGKNSGLEWPNVSAFCYNPDWKNECKEGDLFYPTCQPPAATPGDGNGYFWADSTVEVNAQNDVPHIGPITSEPEDKRAFVTFSTDSENVTVKFSHQLHYVLNEQPESNPDSWDNDTFTEDVYTDWTVSGAGTGSGQWSITGDDPKSNQHSDIIVETSFDVTGLERGEQRQVCQKITYNPKNYTFKTVQEHTHTNHDGDYTRPDLSVDHDADYEVHDSWDWGVESSNGDGYSEACAIIYRPSDAESTPQPSGMAGGDSNSEIMYAGQDTRMTWNTYGETAYTRRLINWQSILYLVRENVGYDPSNTTGNNRTVDPCSYYNGKTSNYYCNSYESGGISYPSNYSYERSPAFAVADYVGAKFCLSFGYQYEYRWNYSTDYDGSFPQGNLSGPYRQYWRTYNASCSTIAKKPSTSIWNGSFMTSGGVKTPLPAYRHDSWDMNSTWKDSGFSNRTLYGSWSEHLDVVGLNIEKHASGSTLANGSKRNGDGFCNDNISSSNTPLTISDTNCNNLGHSGINNNSAYLTKLETYLKNDPGIKTSFTYIDRKSNNEVMNQLGNDMTGTTIVRHSGNLDITHNITTYPGPYNSIYDIPQVIIFVDGDVNIKSGVERIDAWIIASGTINTCNGDDGKFVDGDTAAYLNLLPNYTCSRQLVFNGPVRARNLILNRSFGADNINQGLTGSPLPGRMNSDKQISAEIFNLRADTYLWAYAQASRYDSSYTESYSRELPPRY